MIYCWSVGSFWLIDCWSKSLGAHAMSIEHESQRYQQPITADRSRIVAIAVAVGLIAMYVVVFCLVTFAV
jgi:hypothetical protein